MSSDEARVSHLIASHRLDAKRSGVDVGLIPAAIHTVPHLIYFSKAPRT
jgi:hypothetical protein